MNSKRKKSEDEEFEDFVKGMKERTKLDKFLSSALPPMILSLIAVVIMFFWGTGDALPDTFFSKNIKNDIKTVIENGADINTVKHIYNSRTIKNSNLFDRFKGTEESFYSGNTALSQILNDLEVDYYLSKSTDSIYPRTLKRIIETYNQINPFDKLEPNQKFAFENIRTKLDKNYILIQDDFNRISDELDNKNQLVNKYLQKSNISYWISITALVLTIILSSVQIYQNRYNKRLNDILNRNDKTDEIK